MTEQERERLAIEHIATCTGRFGLILDIRQNPRFREGRMQLSPRQVDAILAHIEREKQWAQERATRPQGPKVEGLRVENLPEGPAYFAVDNDQGELTFLRLRRLGTDATDRWTGQPYRWAGWVFVDQQLGPNYEKRGRIDPQGTYTGPWPTLVGRIMADPLTAMARYGHEIGRCGYCHLPLTNAESRALGIGPVCRERLTRV